MVTRKAHRKDGQIGDTQSLRPTSWLEQHGVAAGTMLPLNIPELQVEGAAFVESVEPCPPIAGGEGSVVTALFKTRQVDQIATVEVLGPNGQIETLSGTTIHPIWSIDRQDWVELGELQKGERLQAADGEAVVLSVTIQQFTTPVYNIEVHGEHVHQAGNLDVLVHSAYQKHIDDGIATVDNVLDGPPDHLKASYRDMGNGRYRPKDGLRQIRFGHDETKNVFNLHIHIEHYDLPWVLGGKEIESTFTLIK